MSAKREPDLKVQAVHQRKSQALYWDRGRPRPQPTQDSSRTLWDFIRIEPVRRLEGEVPVRSKPSAAEPIILRSCTESRLHRVVFNILNSLLIVFRSPYVAIKIRHPELPTSPESLIRFMR